MEKLKIFIDRLAWEYRRGECIKFEKNENLLFIEDEPFILKLQIKNNMLIPIYKYPKSSSINIPLYQIKRNFYYIHDYYKIDYDNEYDDEKETYDEDYEEEKNEEIPLIEFFKVNFNYYKVLECLETPVFLSENKLFLEIVEICEVFNFTDFIEKLKFLYKYDKYIIAKFFPYIYKFDFSTENLTIEDNIEFLRLYYEITNIYEEKKWDLQFYSFKRIYEDEKYPYDIQYKIKYKNKTFLVFNKNNEELLKSRNYKKILSFLEKHF